MAINYDAFTKLQVGMLISKKDRPLDGRLIVEEESQIINIPFPYVGLIVYSKKEDKIGLNSIFCINLRLWRYSCLYSAELIFKSIVDIVDISTMFDRIRRSIRKLDLCLK